MQAKRRFLAVKMGAMCQYENNMSMQTTMMGEDIKPDLNQLQHLTSTFTSPDSSTLSDHYINHNNSNDDVEATYKEDRKSWQYYPKVNANTAMKTPPLILELSDNSGDDKLWRESLFTLIYSQTYNNCEVDLFELMCKVLDNSLFSLVEWARRSHFFKDLKVKTMDKYAQCNVLLI